MDMYKYRNNMGNIAYTHGWQGIKSHFSHTYIHTGTHIYIHTYIHTYFILNTFIASGHVQTLKQERYEIVKVVVQTRYCQYIDIDSIGGPHNFKFTFWKIDKNWSEDYIKTTCTSSGTYESTCKVSNVTGWKMVGGVAHTRCPLFNSNNAWKMTKFNLWKMLQK